MEDAVRMFACVQFLIMGLSHLLQPQAWIDWFAALRAKKVVGVFANGFLSLVFGSVIVAFHNVWSDVSVVLTVIGWAQVVKATVAFVAPQISLRGLERAQHPWQFRVAGVFSLGIAGVMGYVLMGGR